MDPIINQMQNLEISKDFFVGKRPKNQERIFA